MLTSVLSPIQIAQPDPAPPWGWNPAATFLTAYNAQAEERRAQEEFKLKMDMERILFPAKAAKAQFEINQLAYETEVMANAYKLQNESINERRRIIRTGSAVSGSNAAGGVQQDDQQQLGYSNRLKKTSEVGTLGSGLQPLKPLGGN